MPAATASGMASSDSEAIAQLREAVQLSPKNLPLRQALADALLAASRASETEFQSATD